jgi:predicted NBD/HSP70 family sugar kinase
MMDAVSERAAAGDRVVLDALAEVGRWLGIGIGNLINLFNPERVVLGGMYHRLFEFLEGPATRGARRALAAPGSMASIVRSGLGQDAALIGAVELVLSDVIADPAGAVALAASGGPS